MGLIIQKYGGTSVGTLDRIRSVAENIEATLAQGHQLVVVVSAMGQQTDELLKMAQMLCDHPDSREVDMLLTAGERVSMALLAIALQDRGVKSLSLTGSQSGILTDEVHGNARIERISGERIRTILSGGSVAIVAGFQGVCPRSKEVTTLGRGGSDLTAIALAASLGAQRCQVFKDVDGVCTADPRLVANALPISQLSLGSMSRLAWQGAAVLHARAVHVAAKYSVPIEIRSSFNLAARGTIVMDHNEKLEHPRVDGIAHKERMAAAELSIAKQGGSIGLGRVVTDFLWTKGESPLVFAEFSDASHCSIHLIVSQENLEQLRAKLIEGPITEIGRPEISARPVATISIIGQGFNQAPELVFKIREILGEVVVFFQVQNEQITAAVAPAELKPTAEKLHRFLFE